MIHKYKFLKIISTVIHVSSLQTLLQVNEMKYEILEFIFQRLNTR